MLAAQDSCDNEKTASLQNMTAFYVCCRSSYPLLALDQLALPSPLGPIASGLCRALEDCLGSYKQLHHNTAGVTFCDLIDITEG